MFDWLCALIDDCLNCQNDKPKPKHRNEVPLKEWQNETVPFRTIHIDHKGPLHPPSNRNLHCLLVPHLLTHSLDSWWYTQLLTLVLRLLSLLSRNGSIPSEYLNLLCMTAVRLSSIPNSYTGQKNWESFYDLEQRTHLGLMAKLKPRINTLHVIGGTS